MNYIEPLERLRSAEIPWRFSETSYDEYSGGRRERKTDRIRVGLLVPFSGSDAIWGPSCQYSGVLAAARINSEGGILGREIELFAADAGGDPNQVVARVKALLRMHAVNALVGVHLSNVRDAICGAMAGQIPYIFAPQYEGGANAPGVVAIGETPVEQYHGAVRWMVKHMAAKRWYLLGNDYVWPRGTHAVLKKLIKDAGGSVVAEEYLPLASQGHTQTLDRIRSAQPDIVFESLVGSDSVTFNQAFGVAGLSTTIIRLSGAIEENTLMGISPECSENLYCVSGYFNSLQTPENVEFLSQYREAFGETAPIQGGISQSCYESLFALDAWVRRTGSFNMAALSASAENFSYSAARGRVSIQDSRSSMDNFLMQSDGLEYKLVKTFPAN